jgi:hypothetical protein
MTNMAHGVDDDVFVKHINNTFIGTRKIQKKMTKIHGKQRN